MKLNILFLFLCISVAWTQNAGMLTKPGENLISIRGEYSNKEFKGGRANITTIGGDYILGSPFNKYNKYLIEFNLAYGVAKVKFDANNTYNYDWNGLGFSTFFHMKENEQIPFNFKIGGSYAKNKAKAGWIDDLDMIYNTINSGFGGGIYKDVFTQGSSVLTAFANFFSLSTKITQSVPDTIVTINDNFPATAIGVIISNNYFFATPYIGKVDGEADNGIQVGILLPQ